MGGAMSRLKPIQWGTPDSPKSFREYNNLQLCVRQHPGAIIFVTYLDEDDVLRQEIWANSHKYQIGGSGGIGGSAIKEYQIDALFIKENQIYTYDGVMFQKGGFDETDA